MAKKVIGIGSSANDGTGDPLRTGAGKINDNFTELYNHANSTENPHGTSKDDVSLGNVINSLQVINAGKMKSIQADTIGNRPSAGTVDRYFYATDIHKLFRDDGTNWVLESIVNTVGKDADYTATLNDFYIGVTVVPMTLTLPASASTPDGFELEIKDESGNAKASNISINADGSDTIDGFASYSIDTDSGAVTIRLRGTKWNIISHYTFEPPS